jgi:hypothetical protein
MPYSGARYSGAPRRALDAFIQHNPAFALYGIFWMSVGYLDAGHISSKKATPNDLMPVFSALFGLTLLGPDKVREKLPLTANAKLSIFLMKIFNEHPDWRMGTERAITSWSEPFWDAVRLGIASGVLTLDQMRLRPLRKSIRPQVAGNASNTLAEDLQRRASVFGKMVRRDGGEEALLTLLGAG